MIEIKTTQRVSNIIKRAIFKPNLAMKILSDFAKLRLNPLKLINYLVELSLDKSFWDHIDEKIKKAKKYFPDPKLGGWMLGFPMDFIYPIVRLAKPEIVIETGVGPGGSSALILRALKKNGRGNLYSIDLPGYDAVIYPKIGRCYNIHTPPGYEIGWLVPINLRDRWTLILGDSKEELPKLVDTLDHLDLFLHDSLHTDEHILFELTTVFPKLRKGGLLLADDVNEYWSLSFIKFCEKYSLPYFVCAGRLGISIKRN